MHPLRPLLTSPAGFVFFVASLQKGHYRFQFTQFAWTHMALYLIVVQAHFIMNNIFEGMIWFFLPAVSGHHQRHLGLHLRYHLRPHTAHQVVAQEDCRGLSWVLG